MITALESVWRSIADLTESLDEQDWDRSTDCPGWSVKDHVSHMIGTESMLLGRDAPDVAVPEAAHIRNDIGRFNEQWVESLREQSGADVLTRFREVTGERLDSLRALTPEQWDEEGFTPEGPGPYRAFMEIRVFDCWFHEQDIREALDRVDELEGPVADHAIGRIQRVMGYVVGKKAQAPDGSTVVFSITGSPPIDFAVEVDGRARVVDVVPPESTVRLTMDRRTYTRLAGGRRSGEWALDAGLVDCVGDEGLGRAVVTNLAYLI